ncbi:hypothetical protein AB0M46_08175 [Dactylosporangium sp. NPDC051485]|uniref:hypothetical protein n=1 Tax=Dactylosporangium sp. NPDC051485 TaxID=3154846 RepID=UPI003449159F
MATPWILLAFTAAMTVAGAALATNYRDVATKHIRAAQRWSPRLRRKPADPAGFVRLDRMLGAFFAVVGGLAFLLTAIDLIVGPGRFIGYGP